MNDNDNFNQKIAELKKNFKINNKILFIHCPTFDFNAIDIKVIKNRGYYSYPPYGLMCLSAATEEAETDFEILDLNFLLLKKLQNKDTINKREALELIISLLKEKLDKNHYSVIGISAGVTVSNVFIAKEHPFIECLKFLKEKNESIILAGGVIANDETVGLLRHGLCHFVFKGEGEQKLRFFLSKLNDFNFSGMTQDNYIPGIAFALNESIYETQGNLENVEFVWDMEKSYEKIPLEEYNSVGSLSPFSRMAGADKKYATIQLNRGCRGQCTFCGVKPFIGTGIRQTSTDLIVSELDFLVKKKNITHIEWLDDDLLARKDAAHLVLKHMASFGAQFSWAANNGLIAASLDNVTLQLCVDSHCTGFRIGVESGNPEILRQIKKPASIKNLLAFSEKLKNFPTLFVTGCYIIGFEGETYGQMFDTFNLSIGLDLSWNGFSIFQVITKEADVLSEFADAVKSDGENLGLRKNVDFVPTKAATDRSLKNEKLLNYQEIYDLPRNALHDKDLLSEIWFSYNLLSNYIFNKNLTTKGIPEQFVTWTNALSLTHPQNASISLFLGIAHGLLGNIEAVKIQVEKTRTILKGSPYWTTRFKDYYLEGFVDLIEKASKEVIFEAILDLRSKFKIDQANTN